MTSIDSGFDPASLDDDLETELIPLRRRRRLPVLTAILALAAVAGGAFIGGVEVQKHYGGTSGTGGSARAAATSTGADTGGRFGRNGFGGAAGAAGGVTAGQVSVIKGSTLYVTDTSGNTVKVKTAGARVTKTVTASVDSINPGDSVVVRGTQAKDGSYQASTITLGGAETFGGGGFGSGFGSGSTGTGFGGRSSGGGGSSNGNG